VRVVLVDGQPLARAGCRTALEGCDDLVVVGEAGDSASAIRMAVHERPDVVVVHGREPEVDALDVTRRIGDDERLEHARVIVFVSAAGADGHVADGHVFEALRAGAKAVLSRDAKPDELPRAIMAVAAGGAYLAPGVTRRVIGELAARVVPSPLWQDRLALLTEREREVVAAVAYGLSNEGIGRRLHMSPATARTHVSRALTKLGLRDRTQLVVFAYESELVSPGALDPEAHPIYSARSVAS
jgi:DNA-binding NarL/FixJ family response regulator